MRSTLYTLATTLVAISWSYYPVGAATLTVHTQTPKVNIHLPPPKVQVSPSTPTHVNQHDLTITKQTDKSSPKLFEATSKGKHIPKATAYDKKSPKGDDKPKESVTFTYGEVNVQYKPQ